MSINTRFAKSKEIYVDTKYEDRIEWYTKVDAWIENAEKKTIFGGKRFLGLNKNGNEVWIGYTLDRETLDLKVSTTHSLDSLRNNQAQLAQKRVTVGLNKTAPSDLMTGSSKFGVAITENTLDYLQKLMDYADMGIGKVEGKCSTQLFMYISNVIYEGDTEINKGDCRWNDITKTWDLPSGRYFTIYG
tara:strand:+ start:8425 stop:8988 length:564 start_codon:yes stop_codon:yes gene_type:complete